VTYSIEEDARAVLLPAFEGADLSSSTRRFLDSGGVAILLGESRSEYLARGMSAERKASETAATFQKVIEDACNRSGLLLACVDQELGGICRLHDLVPAFPPSDQIARYSESDIEVMAKQVGLAASSLGVNVFLAPIVDTLIGRNDWLHGRTWSSDPVLIGKLSAAFVRGVQQAGVAATVKHFPGFGVVTGDPAVDNDAVNPQTLQMIEAAFPAFQAPIAAGAELVMIGPSIVTALDPEKPALRSGKVVSDLRKRFNFRGVVMADDLDSKATLLGASVPFVALEALSAGCDFLLLADIGTQLDEVGEAIALAARAGRISVDALAMSAQKVRDLAQAYAPKVVST
jgi:beta-N-acetylhexosaminidase